MMARLCHPSGTPLPLEKHIYTTLMALTCHDMENDWHCGSLLTR